MRQGDAGADHVVLLAVRVRDGDREVDGVFRDIERESGAEGVPSGDAIGKGYLPVEDVLARAVEESDIGTNPVREPSALPVNRSGNATHRARIRRIADVGRDAPLH